MNINEEIGNSNLSPYNYSKSSESNYVIYYTFQTEDDDKYIVRFFNLSKIHNKENYGWSVEFITDGETGDKDVINKGRFYKVISTVTSIINEFIKEKQPIKIIISPTKNYKGDKRRLNIYSKYIETLLPDNYKFHKKLFGSDLIIKKIKESVMNKKIMTNYNSFVNENSNEFNRDKIYREILKNIGQITYPFYMGKKGLGYMYIIEDVLKPYEEKLTSNEIQNFKKGLEILKKTSFDKNKIDYLLKKRLPDGIEKKKIIKIDNQWSYVNKLNTNIYDLSNLLTDLIGKMYNDENENIRTFIKPYYDNILLGNTIMALDKMKSRVKKMIEYYFLDGATGKKEELNGLLQYTNNIQKNTETGESAEDNVRNYLVKNGFEIMYIGGNGDFIDMLFGTDMIVHREDFGYITIQVKSYLPNKDKLGKYKTDWIAVSNPEVKIYNKETFDEINV